MQNQRRTTVGVRARHSRRCSVAAGGACDCRPSFEAAVYSPRDGRKVRKTFGTLRDARVWRAETEAAVRRGTMQAPSRTTLAEAAEAWLAGARAGTVRTRSGDQFKPSALRSYERALRQRVIPELGRLRLSAVTRNEVQDFADRLLAAGLDASTVRNAVVPLRSIFRRAVVRGEVGANPTQGVELPAVRGRRDRVASAAEAAALIAALPTADQALWAIAVYAGLRLGELQALRWDDVDLAGGVIRVSRSWDAEAGPITAKSHAGVRNVPIPGALRELLLLHRIERSGQDGLVFGRAAERPFEPSTIRRRALAAWRRAKLEPLTPHEARHTFASLMVAAGVNAKALSTYLGHASITITLDRYGHLMPGNEAETAALFNSYLEATDLLVGAEAP